MTLRGFDVSRWQGTINWDALKGHLDFVIMKATEGTSYIDPDFARNVAAARRLKIPHGFYHYPNVQDPTKEANHFIAACKRVNGEGQSLDFEGNILKASNPVAWAKTFLDRVHTVTHNRPLPYMSNSTTSRFDWSPVVKENYALWDAAWGSGAPDPGHWPFWAMWQTSETGHVAGIGGNVDTDVFNGNLAQLSAYFANDAGTAKPTSPVLTTPKPVTTPPAKTPQPVPGTYKIVSGDTLLGIAHRLGTTTAALMKLNPIIKNANVIKAGWVLHVAGAAPTTKPVSTTGKIYVVRSGDNMTKVAKAVGVSLATLEKLNPQVKAPQYMIFPNEHLEV